jgi:hypothetical protein
LKIDGAEVAQSHPMESKYWLFFDVKNGSTRKSFEGLHADEQSWIRLKLSLAGVDPEHVDIDGYGERVIRQLLESNKSMSELRKATRQTAWRHVFAEFLDSIIWTLAATNRVIT